jgi:hypothetical protein
MTDDQTKDSQPPSPPEPKKRRPGRRRGKPGKSEKPGVKLITEPDRPPQPGLLDSLLGWLGREKPREEGKDKKED